MAVFGKAQYIQVHAVLARLPHARAKILGIDVSAAGTAPGGQQTIADRP